MAGAAGSMLRAAVAASLVKNGAIPRSTRAVERISAVCRSVSLGFCG